jgi:hypothetical protein
MVALADVIPQLKGVMEKGAHSPEYLWLLASLAKEGCDPPGPAAGGRNQINIMVRVLS